MKMYSSVWVVPKRGVGIAHWSYTIRVHAHARTIHATNRAQINIRFVHARLAEILAYTYTYGIRRLSSQSYTIKCRRALSSFRQSAGCASKLIMHTNRRDTRIKVSLSLSLSLALATRKCLYFRLIRITGARTFAFSVFPWDKSPLINAW